MLHNAGQDQVMRWQGILQPRVSASLQAGDHPVGGDLSKAVNPNPNL